MKADYKLSPLNAAILSNYPKLKILIHTILSATLGIFLTSLFPSTKYPLVLKDTLFDKELII